MRYLFFLPFFLLSLVSMAQPNPIGDFNSEAAWIHAPRISEMPAHKLSATDTCLIVISNRKTSTDSLRYMSEERDGKKLHYFFVFTHDGKWNVLPVNSIEEALKYVPDINNDWLLYTEGMGKLFTSDLARGLTVAGQYKLNVILFDYPSISTSKKQLGNYFFAIGNARTAYLDFADAFKNVMQLRTEKKMGTGKLTMLYHSMGNHVIRQLVKHHMLAPINDKIWVDNLVLNAPCVPRRGHKKWINKIAFAKRIYVNYNNNDFTLGGAYLASKKIQLGQKPVRNISNKVIYVNFNTLVDRGHSNFLSIPGREPAKPAAIRYYNTILHGDATDMKNEKQFAVSRFKKIGWELLP